MKKFLLTFAFFCALWMTAAICASADSIAIEAESSAQMNNFTVMDSSEASGGKYITAQSTNASSTISKEEHLGAVETEYKFSVEKAGNYNIYARVKISGDGDSNWVTLDGVLWALHYGTGHMTEFFWRKVGIRTLEPGEHTLRLYCREIGAGIDKVVITSNPLFVPNGMGELPEGDEKLYEDGTGMLTVPLPADVPPSEHPRVMLSKSQLTTIRQNLTHPQNIDTYQKLLMCAARTVDMNTTRYDTNLLETIESKAFLYLMNEDKSQGREAAELVMNYARNFSLGAGSATDSSMRSVGHFIFITSCVYDWCYDCFTAEERTEYIERMENLATLNFEGGYPIVEELGNMDSMNSHKTENPVFKDLLAFAIAVYDEKPFVYNNIVGVLYANYIHWRNDWYPGGWNHQGGDHTYGTFRTYFEVMCNYLLGAIGQKNAFVDAQRLASYKFIYSRRPDGNYLMDGDQHYRSLLNSYLYNDNALHFLIGNYYKDATVKWRYFKDRPLNDYTNQNISGISPALYLIVNDTEVALDNTKKLPLTRYFGSPIGTMIARTSWEEGADSPAAIAVMKLYENYFGQHMHREVGSFQFYYKGMLALDAGAYESPSYVDENGKYVQGSVWGTGHYMNYLSNPVAHNCLLVYDSDNPSEIKYGGQRFLAGGSSSLTSYADYKNGKFKTGEVVGYDYGPDLNEPEYSYIEGDITAAYRSDRVKDYSRSFMFLNLFDEEIPAALIVYDRVESTDSGLQKSWLLHSQEEPELDGKSVTIRRTLDHNNGRLVNQMLLPQNAKIEKIGGEGYNFWDGEQNLYIETYEEGDEAGAWRVEIKPEEKQKQDYFLNVMQVSDNRDDIKPLDCRSEEQGPFVGIFIKDRAVYMKKDKGKVYSDFSVSAQGEGERSFIITNLAEGKWTIYGSCGKIVASQVVNADNGVLYFKASAGSYTVKWDYEKEVPEKNFDVTLNSKTAEKRPVEIYANNHYDGRAYLENGTVMVALKDIAEMMGYDCEISSDGASAISDEGKIVFKAGSRQALKDGQRMELSEAPAVYQNTIFVPVESLMEIYRFSAEYNTMTYILHLQYGFYVKGAKPEIVNSRDGDRASIIDATCSMVNAPGNEAYKSLDNDYTTYWCSAGRENQWIRYELAESYELTGIGLAWHSGMTRKESFAVFVSEDDKNWTKVWSGQSGGKTDRIERLSFKQTHRAKYVKVETYGNTSNEMNSLNETQIYCKEREQ